MKSTPIASLREIRKRKMYKAKEERVGGKGETEEKERGRKRSGVGKLGK